MKCPFCAQNADRVVDSRESRDGRTIRRRRECLSCGRRFTSYEQIEDIRYMVVKSDGRREAWSPPKLLGGLRKACEKRPIPEVALERVVAEVERRLTAREERELTTAEIGGVVMDELRRLDDVAYVRFASVYRRFEDAGSFVEEVRSLRREPAGGVGVGEDRAADGDHELAAAAVATAGDRAQRRAR